MVNRLRRTLHCQNANQNNDLSTGDTDVSTDARDDTFDDDCIPRDMDDDESIDILILCC